MCEEANERKGNQQYLGTIRCSNLCSKTVEYPAPDEVAVYNQNSIAVNVFVKSDETYDYEELKHAATINLNKISDVNSTPGVKAVVAMNLDELVANSEKDILVEFCAPQCRHYRKLTPAFGGLGEKMADEEREDDTEKELQMMNKFEGRRKMKSLEIKDQEYLAKVFKEIIASNEKGDEMGREIALLCRKVEHIAAPPPVAAIKETEQAPEPVKVIKTSPTKQNAKKEKPVPTEAAPVKPRNLLSVIKETVFNDYKEQNLAIESANLKVANAKVQTAVAVPVDIEEEVSLLSKMNMILVSFFSSSYYALYVSQAAHIPHLMLHLGAQHGGGEGSTYNQTENCDMEKPRVEQKTIYEDRCKTGNGENCVSLYDTIFDTISTKACTVLYDKDWSMVSNRESRVEYGTISKTIQHRQCRKVEEISQKLSSTEESKEFAEPKETESKEYQTTGKGIKEDDDKVEKEKETVGDELSNDGIAGPVSDDDPGFVPSDASADSDDENFRDDETLPLGWKMINQIPSVKTKPADCYLCDQVSEWKMSLSLHIEGNHEGKGYSPEIIIKEDTTVDNEPHDDVTSVGEILENRFHNHDDPVPILEISASIYQLKIPLVNPVQAEDALEAAAKQPMKNSDVIDDLESEDFKDDAAEDDEPADASEGPPEPDVSQYLQPYAPPAQRGRAPGI